MADAADRDQRMSRRAASHHPTSYHAVLSHRHTSGKPKLYEEQNVEDYPCRGVEVAQHPLATPRQVSTGSLDSGGGCHSSLQNYRSSRRNVGRKVDEFGLGACCIPFYDTYADRIHNLKDS